MSLNTTQRRMAKKRGLVFLESRPLLTPEQAATVQQWDAENRAQALGEERKDE